MTGESTKKVLGEWILSNEQTHLCNRLPCHSKGSLTKHINALNRITHLCNRLPCYSNGSLTKHINVLNRIYVALMNN
jgi:hypothetical protein